MSQLSELHSAISVCTLCRLHQTRTKAVPGDGPENASIMLIGEGPGFNEDQQGLPFVGAAGKFLDQLLQSVGVSRKDVYITNVVKCRPPNNRDPLPNETAACSHYLDRQIDFIKPRVIITLGRYSLARFFPRDTITRLHGKAQTVNGALVYPMYHPAAALHNGDLRRVIEEDFKRLPDVLKQAHQLTRPQQPSGTQPDPQPKQISMF